MGNGDMFGNDKSSIFYVWPVHSGQSGSFGSSVIFLPKTGQTTCYDSAGNVISCAGTGQDGEIQAGVQWPDPRFNDNGDGTITDNLTGLMWTKDANAPGPAACSPSTTKNWQGALDYVACLNANAYLGYSDWRLPNIIELESLINGKQSNTTTWLNTQGFSNVPAGRYWSSNSYVNDPIDARIVNMWWSYSWGVYKASSPPGLYDYVWPVRTGQVGRSVYSIHGTVTENGVGLGGVTVTLGGDTLDTTTTASDGTYSFTSLSDGNYTITPGLDGYSFTPPSRSITVSGADVSAQDFSAISIVIFSDDFNDNVIDPIKWTDITGYSVTEANGIMKVEQGAIDNGGNLWSGWIDINPDNVLTIYRKIYLQYWSFWPDTPAFIGNFKAYLDQVPGFTFGIEYGAMYYSSGDFCSSYGFFITRNNATSHVCSQLTDVSQRIEPVWRGWFDEKIVYNPKTGLLEYFINGQKRTEFNVGVLPDLDSYRIRFNANAWGWQTGHLHFIDDIRVTQGGGGLAYSTETGYGNDGVSPDSGTKSNSFTYKVVYKNASNNLPSFVKIHIDNDVTGSAMSLDMGAAVTLRDGDYTNGEQYIYTTTLATGNHNYYFTASDGTDITRLPSTGMLSGPAVTNLTFADGWVFYNGVVGIFYFSSLPVSGGTPPYTWSVPSGLPPGLTLDGSTGFITGIPTIQGTYGFTAYVTDSNSYIYSRAFSITIDPNQPPVANDQSVSTSEDIPVVITLTGSDPGGRPITFSIVSVPLNGILNGIFPNLSYTPDINFNGSDGFTFKVNDGWQDSNIATVSITVTPVNDPPVLNSIGPKSVNEGSPLSFAISGSDPDGDQLTFSATGLPTGAIYDPVTRTFSWTSDCTQGGSHSVTFTVSDGNLTDSEIVAITVNDISTLNTYYRDADGDAYGNASVTTQVCAQPSGYVSNSADCNDSSASINPGAIEVCNGVDDNCNGQVDEGVLNTYYRDADGDTYGNASVTIQACVVPTGYVTNYTDCNDGNISVNPGANEVCNGIDDNCDGQVDEGCVSSTTPTGSNVEVTPTSDVTLTFTDITTSGTTGVTTSGTGQPPPSGFRLGNPPGVFVESSG